MDMSRGEYSFRKTMVVLVIIILLTFALGIIFGSVLGLLSGTRTITETVAVPAQYTIYRTEVFPIFTTTFVTETTTSTFTETRVEKIFVTETITETIIVTATALPSLSSRKLMEKEVVNQPAGACTCYRAGFERPGFLEVIIHSSTSTNTYVSIRYASYSVKFEKEIKVGSSGVAAFPILPCELADICVCNSNFMSGASHTISIVYKYW